MKNTILTRRKIEYLFHHILGGFKTTTEGLRFVRSEVSMSDAEYIEWLEKNAQRLIDRIEEFKITHKLMSVGFAFLFMWMQATDQELDMRRARRRTGRRRNESAYNQQFSDVPTGDV